MVARHGDRMNLHDLTDDELDDEHFAGRITPEVFGAEKSRRRERAMREQPDYEQKVAAAQAGLQAVAGLDPGVIGTLLGGALMVGAADAQTTPRALVDRLRASLPTDEEWNGRERAYTTEAVKRIRTFWTSTVLVRRKTGGQG